MYGEYTTQYTLYTQHTMYVILYNLYIVHIDSQLYFDIMFHCIYQLSVQNKCALCTMFIVQRTAYTYHILIGWQAYRGDQIHRKNSPT